jgi:hypothetical protein
MSQIKFIQYLVLLLVCINAQSAIAKELHVKSIYFDFDKGIIEELRGSYVFKYRKVEFIKDAHSDYIIKTTGDTSPSEAYLRTRNGYTFWILSRSNENWFVIKNVFKKGDHWKNYLRGWQQTYDVTDTNYTLETPAGTFHKCAKIKISWIAHEQDMSGPQEKIIYLAPHLGIAKQEYYENGYKWHEEVSTSYRKSNE